MAIKIGKIFFILITVVYYHLSNGPIKCLTPWRFSSVLGQVDVVFNRKKNVCKICINTKQNWGSVWIIWIKSSPIITFTMYWYDVSLSCMLVLTFNSKTSREMNWCSQKWNERVCTAMFDNITTKIKGWMWRKKLILVINKRKNKLCVLN